MDNRKLENAVFELEVTLDKLSALYSLFADQYIDTKAPVNKAVIESRGAIGCILFDLISEAQAHLEDVNAAMASRKEVG